MFIDNKMTGIYVEIQKILKPDISIEVGAYDAEFSQFMSNLGVICHAFEANPNVYEKFKNNLTNIVYINKAVTDSDSPVIFYIQDREEDWADASNSIKHRVDNAKIKEFVVVESISLDQYVKPKNEKICLWVDCEGANDKVLLGSKNILKNVDSIFIEVEITDQWLDSWNSKDVEKYLEQFDFVMVKQELFWEGQANCIFIKRNLINNEIFKLLNLS